MVLNIEGLLGEGGPAEGALVVGALSGEAGARVDNLEGMLKVKGTGTVGVRPVFAGDFTGDVGFGTSVGFAGASAGAWGLGGKENMFGKVGMVVGCCCVEVDWFKLDAIGAVFPRVEEESDLFKVNICGFSDRRAGTGSGSGSGSGAGSGAD